jgi:hypothetical protein
MNDEEEMPMMRSSLRRVTPRAVRALVALTMLVSLAGGPLASPAGASARKSGHGHHRSHHKSSHHSSSHQGGSCIPQGGGGDADGDNGGGSSDGDGCV